MPKPNYDCVCGASRANGHYPGTYCGLCWRWFNGAAHGRCPACHPQRDPCGECGEVWPASELDADGRCSNCQPSGGPGWATLDNDPGAFRDGH
jgi:hypothetical protein